MLYPELIVREVLENTKQAKYGNVDMGIKENISRGAVVSGLRKSLDNGFSIWLTFLPDTMHNRSILLQKQGLTVLVSDGVGGFVVLSKDWIEMLYGDIEGLKATVGSALPPNMDRKPLIPGLSAEETVSAAQGSQVSSGMQTNIAPPPAAKTTAPKGTQEKPKKGAKVAAPAAAPSASAMPDASAMPSGEGQDIGTFEDFLGLSKMQMIQALQGDVPQELLQEIAGYSGEKIDTEVIEIAFAKMN